MEESVLDFEVNLAEKNDGVRHIMSEIGSSENMERDTVASELEMTLINNL